MVALAAWALMALMNKPATRPALIKDLLFIVFSCRLLIFAKNAHTCIYSKFMMVIRVLRPYFGLIIQNFRGKIGKTKGIGESTESGTI
jgi:hypothetical protein